MKISLFFSLLFVSASAFAADKLYQRNDTKEILNRYGLQTLIRSHADYRAYLIDEATGLPRELRELVAGYLTPRSLEDPELLQALNVIPYIPPQVEEHHEARTWMSRAANFFYIDLLDLEDEKMFHLILICSGSGFCANY